MAEYIEKEKLVDALNEEIEKIRDFPRGVNGEGVILFGIAAVVKVVKKIPAANVRPVVRSKWIKMKFFPDWECEKCGSVISGNTPDPWNHYHFCPNCGAMMEES